MAPGQELMEFACDENNLDGKVVGWGSARTNRRNIR